MKLILKKLVFKLEIQNLRAVDTYIWPVYVQYIEKMDNWCTISKNSETDTGVQHLLTKINMADLKFEMDNSFGLKYDGTMVDIVWGK